MIEVLVRNVDDAVTKEQLSNFLNAISPCKILRLIPGTSSSGKTGAAVIGVKTWQDYRKFRSMTKRDKKLNGVGLIFEAITQGK